ncbi:MAG: glycoside hydrolase family 15 protein, partial [Polyangiaceae bacterium]
MVLKTHQDKDFRGATVASLSTPWGQSRPDVGGYHLVWPRDLCEAAGGFLALGDVVGARYILEYLIATQQPDGHWYQNQWLSGEPYWRGIQLDEVGLPILLVAALAERDELRSIPASAMVRRAASFIARNGPSTAQDRWEEDAGLNPFTLAVCIAALVCAADFLEDPARSYALELADAWNARIEQWTYVTGTAIAKSVGVAGHYVRSAPPDAFDPSFDLSAWAQSAGANPSRLLGLECLALVRAGLRSADDPRILDSVRAIDAVLRVETPNGPVWHRYPHDRYGEEDDGAAPHDGKGVGRGWPLLTGERGHYAFARKEDAMPYAMAMANVAGGTGMITE